MLDVALSSPGISLTTDRVSEVCCKWYGRCVLKAVVDAKDPVGEAGCSRKRTHLSTEKFLRDKVVPPGGSEHGLCEGCKYSQEEVRHTTSTSTSMIVLRWTLITLPLQLGSACNGQGRAVHAVGRAVQQGSACNGAP